MEVKDEIRLRHRLDAAVEAATFAESRTRADLEQDRILTLALVKSVEIIGEAARNVTESTKAELPLVPWPEIVGIRHRLVHAYFDINHDILWDTVVQNLPPLIAALKNALGDMR